MVHAWTMHGISMDHAWDRMGPQYGQARRPGQERYTGISNLESQIMKELLKLNLS